MFLTDEEKKMHAGESGPGAQRAIDLLVKYGNAFDAEKLVEVASAHVMIEGPYSFFRDMTEGATARTFVTTEAPLESPCHLKLLGISVDFDIDTRVRLYQGRVDIAKRMGFYLTDTCAPYMVGSLPKKNDIVSWMESSAEVYINSMLGARTNREAMSAALASAVTGRTPYMGLLMPENRFAQVHVRLTDLDADALTKVDYGTMGYYIGGLAGSRNVVIEGLPVSMSLEQCKHLCSALPCTGSVALCHMVGLTPEANTLEQALGNGRPEEVIEVGKKEMRQTWETLSTAGGEKVDLVTFGCPHCSIAEVAGIARGLEGKRVHPEVKLFVGAPGQVISLAQRMGFAGIIEGAGGFLMDDCGGPANPFLFFGKGIKTVATDSTKAAAYVPSVSEAQVFYGDMAHCIEAAITGKWRGEPK